MAEIIRLAGIVRAISADTTWNTRELQSLRVTAECDITDGSKPGETYKRNIELPWALENPNPRVGDHVVVLVTLVPVDNSAPEPPPEEGDEDDDGADVFTEEEAS